MTTPRRKACVECRQQKIRCDVEQHRVPHDPCSRCKKMGIECRILPTSTRNLRQTKAEMRRELEELKWAARHSADPNQMLPAPNPCLVPIEGQPVRPMPPSGAYSTTTARTEGSMSMSPSFQPTSSRPGTRDGSLNNAATLSRVLDDLVVDGKRIDDTFALYFTQYHPLLPILDTSLSPNEYYEISQFLFWAIVVTGSRRYAEDPTIHERVGQLITPLAFSSMALRSTPIPVIQGLIILCTWRLPTSSTFKDITHVLCGAAVHLATQIGLHVAGVGQDFARTPLKKDQYQKIMRAKLWMHCMIVYIRSSCAEGIPPLVIAEPILDGYDRGREDLIPHLPANLVFQHKVHITLLRAMSAMARMDLKSPNCDVNVLRSMIRMFDAQLQSLAAPAPSEADSFQLSCARIHVMAFHFFADPANPDLEALVQIYSLCLSLTQSATALAERASLFATFPSFIDRTMTLAGFIILKLVRSAHAQLFDLAAGEQAYFQAVQFCKSMSLQHNDLSARAAAIMTSLWGSSRVFKRKDGSGESLGLRLRTRLSMSVSFDMLWYWREEFGNMPNPYSEDKSSGAGDDNASMPSTGHQPETPRMPTRPTAYAVSTPVNPPSQCPLSQSSPSITPSTSYPGTLTPSAQEFEKREFTGPAGAVGMKYPTELQQPPCTMNFDPALEGYDPHVNPLLEEFLDYDYAASYDFSNDWQNNPGLNPAVPPPQPSTEIPDPGYGPTNMGG